MTTLEGARLNFFLEMKPIFLIKQRATGERNLSQNDDLDTIYVAYIQLYRNQWFNQ